MPEIETLSLRFSGNKVELKRHLAEWCKKAGKTQNGLVIELIEELLKAQNLKE
jgi:hypothetical protein